MLRTLAFSWANLIAPTLPEGTNKSTYSLLQISAVGLRCISGVRS